MSPSQLVRDLVDRRNDLLYAAKSAVATLSKGKHFPEYLDGNPETDVALLLSAIALAERPIDLGLRAKGAA